MMRLYKRLALLTISAVVLAGCASGRIGTSPRGLEVPIEKAAIRLSADMKTGGYKIVTTDELKKWLDDGREMTVVSALPAADEKKYGIIAGSVNAAMPLTESDITPEDREHLLTAAGSNEQRLLVVYSGFMACRRSHIGAKLLVDKGFKNVYRYPAGISGWLEAGL